MRCLMCKGSLKDEAASFMLDLGGCIIIIKNVPAQVCSQCGEVSYSYAVTKNLENIVNKVKALVSDVAVFEYSKLAS